MRTQRASKRPKTAALARLVFLVSSYQFGCEARHGFLLSTSGLFGLGKSSGGGQANQDSKEGNGIQYPSQNQYPPSHNQFHGQQVPRTHQQGHQHQQQKQQRPEPPRVPPHQYQQQGWQNNGSRGGPYEVEQQKRPGPPPVPAEKSSMDGKSATAGSTGAPQGTIPPPPPLPPTSKGKDNKSSGEGEEVNKTLVAIDVPNDEGPSGKGSAPKVDIVGGGDKVDVLIDSSAAVAGEKVENFVDELVGGDDTGSDYPVHASDNWFQANGSYQQHSNQYQKQQEWYGNQNHAYHDSYYHDDQQVTLLQHELDQALDREGDLFTQLQNLSATIFSMEQRESDQIHQLDVLTDRIADVEAQSASDRLLIAEYDANCTALVASLNELEDELDKWQARCADLAELREQDEQALNELKDDLKAKASEAEELAVVIEKLHFAEKQRQTAAARSKPQKGSFIAWLFGMSSTEDVGDDAISSEEAHEMAKSTLLRALQAERNSVHELESIVSSLQQNNSAISEVVISRDSIIEELNNRIAVFEEDKVVMKAALRQLQKEMKEEAPKTQRLMKDLDKSKKEIKKLKSKIDSLLKTHQDEVESLKRTIQLKDETIAGSESNMTTIGTYVSKLEERLTSFGMARRDIEIREKKCDEIEAKARKTEEEMRSLLAQMKEQEKDQEDLKKLFQDMTSERSLLRKENRELLDEKESVIVKLQGAYADVQTISEKLNETLIASEEMERRTKELASGLQNAEENTSVLENRILELEALESEYRSLLNKYEEVQVSLQRAKNEQSALTNENSDLVGKIDELELQVASLKEMNDKQAKEMERKPPPVPPVLGTRPSTTMHRPPPKKDLPMAEKTEEKTNERKDPLFRGFRKRMAKLTGIHGALTPKSEDHVDPSLLKPGKVHLKPDVPGVPPKPIPVVGETSAQTPKPE